MSDGGERRGKFAVSQAGLVADETTTAEVVRFEEIVKVKKVSHAFRNGTLIGAAIGLGLTLPVLPSCESDDCGTGVLLLGGIGAGAGALIGFSVGR